MSIISQLSSQSGDRTEAANRAVAEQCLARPELLAELAPGLAGNDPAIAGDCAEVLTKVAETRPELVAPHAKALIDLLDHKTTRVRWEAMHALALIAETNPRSISPLLPRLEGIIGNDGSTIVRDHAVEALARYAGTGKAAAQRAYPLLQKGAIAWEGKHAGRALTGLMKVAEHVPGLREQIHDFASRFLDAGKGVVRTAAKKLVKATQKI